MNRVSTKMEEVWYIDPELMAVEDQPASASRVESAGPAVPDPTVSLGDSDMEDLVHAYEGDLQDEARHYREVSLRGALLMSDVTNDELELDTQGALARVLDGSQVSPAALALLCFLAGVSMTLVGVLIVL